MQIPYHKIKDWSKDSGNRRLIWRSLGLVALLIGLGLIIQSQFYRSTSYPYGEGFTLPSGEEESVKQAPVELYTDEGELIDKESVSGNRIVIPKMGVNAEILEGGIEVLAQGVWLMPDTSTPDKGGNTVITAHRWKFRPPDPRTFYNIDKMEIGDRFDVYWQDKKYTYEVNEIKIVTPDQTEILYPTKKSQITLFSCTPLFKTTNRLVVVAELVEN